MERNDEVKYLGLIIQKNYRFDSHVKCIREKLMKDLNVLKMLSSKNSMAAQDTLRKIIIALAIPKIAYCIEIYGFILKVNVNKLNVQLNNMKRLLLRSFCTTPRTTLTAQAMIPDFDTIKIKALLNCYVRMTDFNEEEDILRCKRKMLIEDHLLQMGCFSQDDSRMEFTKIKSDIIRISPQTTISSQIFLNIFKKKKEDLDVKEVGTIFKDFLFRKNFGLCLYTDGSKTEDSTAFAVTTVDNIKFLKKIHHNSSIFTAESLAILQAVKIISDNGIDNQYHAIFTDSRSVLDEMISLKGRKSQIVSKIISSANKNIYFVWVPGHFGIEGNEYVDKMAFKSHSIPLDLFEENELLCSDFKLVIKKYLNNLNLIEWNSLVDNKYQIIHPSLDYVNQWNLNKKDQMVINRLRAGHTYLTHSYLLAKVDKPSCKNCSEVLTVEHLFTCMANPRISYSSVSGSDDNVIM